MVCITHTQYKVMINDILGTENSDRLFSTDGDDNIEALGGNDTIVGSVGDDTLNGGAGFDTVDFSQSGVPVTILPMGVFDNGSQGILVRAERIIGATSQPNTIDAAAVSGDAAFNLNLDRRQLSIINLPPEIGTQNFEVRNFVNVNGTPNDDLIIGDNKDNTFDGGGGQDFLDGRSGNDLLFGSDGNDTLLGGNDLDTLNGGIGNDTLNGGSGNDELSSGEGDDALFGGNDNDLLDSGLGDDSLLGGSGNDQLLGFDGDDTLNGGSDRDTLEGGVGNDILIGGSSSDVFVLSAGAGTDTITDFERDNDSIALSGGISFNDLSFSGSDINFGSETIATFNRFDATTLAAGDFV